MEAANSFYSLIFFWQLLAKSSKEATINELLIIRGLHTHIFRCLAQHYISRGKQALAAKMSSALKGQGLRVAVT